MELAQEHRAVDLEVIVVTAVDGVEVLRTRASQIFSVGDDCDIITGDDVLIMPAKHVDVGGHVL